MAPKGGKDSPLEFCTSIIQQGNSIAVHALEYLSDAKTVRHGFKDLAIEFLDASRPLFPAKTGMTKAASSRTDLPAPATRDLQALLRQYSTNFTVLNQMVSKLLDHEKKQGFSRWANRMTFSDTDIDKMKLSLSQLREAAMKNALFFTWWNNNVNADIATFIGYTALAAVLDRPDPTRGRVQAEAPLSPPLSPPVAPTYAEAPADSQALPLRQASRVNGYVSPRNGHRDLPSPGFVGIPGARRESFAPTTLSSESSRATTETHSSRSRLISSMESDVTTPSSVEHAEEIAMMYAHNLDHASSLQPVRVKVDPATVPRWKPKNIHGTLPAGSKTELLVAVQQQNHEMVEDLLDCGAAADHGPECNLARIAIMNHDFASLRLLLLFGADANAKDKDGFSPLYAATEASFIEAAQLLLKYGASPDMSAGPLNESPFALSLRDGKAAFAHLFLKHGASPDLIMENGDTAFEQAMDKTTAMPLVELMLAYGADVNNKNGRGETALFKAINNAHRHDLVTILLDNGANPNLPGPKHMLWPSVHHPHILELILQRGADLKRAPGCLELATSINSIDAVQILLKHGVDVNAKKDGIFTPLCTAIRDNREYLVDMLIAAHADPNLPASEYPAFKCVTHHRAHLLPKVLAAGADASKPPGIIETAVQHNNKDALLLLLRAGIDANARSASGHTALTTAIRKQDLESIDILLSYGAEPSVRGQEYPISMAVKHPEILAKLLPHITPSRIPKGVMEQAVQADQLESVKLLLDKGCDVEEKNGGVFSPLTTSIREDRKAIFLYLLNEAGADPNLPGEHLPIIKSIRRHREDDLSYIKALLAKGADINLMYRGWNAVLQALDKGDTQTLRLLAQMGTPDLNAKDEDGNTVLEIMHERGMTEEEQILTGGRSKSPTSQANSQLRELVRQ